PRYGNPAARSDELAVSQGKQQVLYLPAADLSVQNVDRREATQSAVALKEPLPHCSVGGEDLPGQIADASDAQDLLGDVDGQRRPATMLSGERPSRHSELLREHRAGETEGTRNLLEHAGRQAPANVCKDLLRRSFCKRESGLHMCKTYAKWPHQLGEDGSIPCFCDPVAGSEKQPSPLPKRCDALLARPEVSST